MHEKAVNWFGKTLEGFLGLSSIKPLLLLRPDKTARLSGDAYQNHSKAASNVPSELKGNVAYPHCPRTDSLFLGHRTKER
eukprot:493928-Amphidinium_carterae.1